MLSIIKTLNTLQWKKFSMIKKPCVVWNLLTINLSENLRRRVPYAEVTQTLYLETYDEFDWLTRGIFIGYKDDWLEKMAREPVRNKIRVLYDDIYGDDPD